MDNFINNTLNTTGRVVNTAFNTAGQVVNTSTRLALNSSQYLVDNSPQIILTIVQMILAIYASNTNIRLPPMFVALFDNGIFRIAILSLIAWRATKEPLLSILTAIIFVNLMNALNSSKQKEGFAQVRELFIA
jgi:ABC-type proline/glycine betaine transport system permease subunit